MDKKKRNRSRKITGRREKKEIIALFQTSYRGIKKNLENLNQQLDQGKGLSDEGQRFIKNSPELIKSIVTTLEILETEKEEEEEGLKDMPLSLQRIVEKFFTQQEVYQIAYDTTAKLTKYKADEVYKDFNYVRCKACGELHNEGEECPWITLAKKNNIEVNEDFSRILKGGKGEEEDIEET